MADRAKVTKALENCVRNGVCINCEYEEHIACKICLMADALELLKEYANTMNKLRGAMEDMKDGIASEAVSYLLTLMDKWEGR